MPAQAGSRLPTFLSKTDASPLGKAAHLCCTSIAMGQIFQQAELEAIASALGDTAEGLTNPEIDRLIETCAMVDPGPTRPSLNVRSASRIERGFSASSGMQ
ncbi:hypothetical protein [Sphingobium sp.]|uniref:hypothetical protein n=1 Tax=Sphingobium sp. TaxID=1912891 RepID=UPI002CEE0B78|nr:hypothetical protein [Sphingobium sp.]HUD92512.1 hypothetical protein [Sphingobium sp.]